MTFGKLSFAAVALAGFIGLSATSSQASPFAPAPALSGHGGIVQAQFHHGRRVAPPRRVCKWETVTKRVHGRLVRERVEKCRLVRR